VSRSYPQALKNWSTKYLDGFETVTVKFFTQRHSHSKQALAGLKRIPIKLVFCDKDVAYGRDYIAEFEDQLRAAGCVDNVDLLTLHNAPHFGCATHEHEYVNFPDFPLDLALCPPVTILGLDVTDDLTVVCVGIRLNPSLHDFVANSFQGRLPPAPSDTTSPFELQLKKAGWADDEEEDDYL
jgi:hypothetical protein